MPYSFRKVPSGLLKGSRKPQEGYSLGGVVLVTDEGNGYCYIKFDQRLVDKLGRQMPYGIGPDNLAYLKVVKKYDHYDVLCCYVDKSKRIAMWKEDVLPSWVKLIRRKEITIDASGAHS